MREGAGAGQLRREGEPEEGMLQRLGSMREGRAGEVERGQQGRVGFWLGAAIRQRGMELVEAVNRLKQRACLRRCFMVSAGSGSG